MPKEFTLTGEIGWELGVYEFENVLKEANGEDVLINFSSPGGSVYTGLKIFNLIKRYQGNVDFNLIGLAASMGSYIPLAGRRVTAEANVVFMIHNAWSYTSGDHNEMRSQADVLEGLSGIIRDEYARRTRKPKDELTAMMDADTYLFGQEAVDAGFVDELNGEPATADAKIQGIALAKEAHGACIAKLKSEMPDDLDRAASVMKIGAVTEEPQPQTEEITIMTLDELKAKHPELYAQIFAAGRTEGVSAEKDRVTAHILLGVNSGDIDTAIAAVENGDEMTATISAKYQIAAMNRTDQQTRDDDDPAGADGADGGDPNASDAGGQVVDMMANKLGVDLDKEV